MAEDNVYKSLVNALNGGQNIFANDNATVYVVQNNNIESVDIPLVKCRTQEYANKWNENMFLNNFNKRDKNVGMNIKLADLYFDGHLPHYIWKDNNDEIWTDLKKLLLSEYIENSNNKMLLILGQPGIGKSTLITWITANFKYNIDDILVYQFATDLKNIDWQNTREKYNIADDILITLGLPYYDLNGKTLIIDGFDEISVGSREEILNKLYWQFIKEKSLTKFSLIITCRENYIQYLNKLDCDYITLQSWDEEQIESFYRAYQNKTGSFISKDTVANILKNKEILGVPLILYMVLALNISIEKEGSIVDVYDRIFSLEGGIYDRCIDNKSFADVHRIGKIKEQVHQISREIAIWIFENNPDEAYISQKDYKKICFSVTKESKQKNDEIEKNFKIGNFFKSVRHCEGVETEKLFFVHRTIYEYFVAETICNSIETALIKLSDKSREELAENIAIYLKDGNISYTIGEYLRNKILKVYKREFGIQNQKSFYEWWESAFYKMMNVGMFYYSGKNIRDFRKILDKEINCFINLIKLLRILNIHHTDYLPNDNDCKNFRQYVNFYIIKFRELYKNKRIDLKKVYLSKINLINFDLQEVDLEYTYLEGAYLEGANLEGANLEGANLEGANLNGAKLRKANLKGVNLEGAKLKKADFRNAITKGIKFDRAEIDNSVWLECDVKQMNECLKLAVFNEILVEDGKVRKRIHRKEIFF